MRNYWLAKYTRNELLERRYYEGIAARNYDSFLSSTTVLVINEALVELDVIHNV